MGDLKNPFFLLINKDGNKVKKGFEKFNLSEEILKALHLLGYNSPTKIQDKVIGEVLLNKDLIVKAQTGSGKTGSFVIPLCEKIKWEENDPQVLILAPTRELAIQIQKDVKNIGRYKRIKGVTLYGKAPFKDQERELKSKTHVVIGTPGRVLDHMDRKTLNTKNIKYVVIDEADEMLNMGFIKQIEAVFRRLNKKRVTLLFSATIKDEIRNLACKNLYKPLNIEIESDKLITDNIDHYLIRTTNAEKDDFLLRLLIKEKPDTAVIFCRTKENVDKVFKLLKDESYSVDKIHGGMMQADRIKSMENYKSGKFRILVATDVAARGIDVENITHVINYDIPMELDSYVHRIGRTARIGKSGKAITIISEYEEQFLQKLQEYIGINLTEINKDKLMCSKEEVQKANEILSEKPKKKDKKDKNLDKNITKIFLNGGKKKKIRVLDIVGTISNIEGISSDDIGIIDVKDNCSYVDILNGKGKHVLDVLKNKTIKGKKLKVEIAKDK